jgi:hypothetical protein
VFFGGQHLQVLRPIVERAPVDVVDVHIPNGVESVFRNGDEPVNLNPVCLSLIFCDYLLVAALIPIKVEGNVGTLLLR